MRPFICMEDDDQPVTVIGTLNQEDFQASFGAWTTPGSLDPQTAWSRTAGATPSASTGPDGGSNPATRAVDVTNAYAFTEASFVDGPWSLQSPQLDASAGLLTLTFDVHMRFGSVGGIADGTLIVQGWNGSAWSQIGATITGSQQTSATAAWLPSTDYGAFDSDGFGNSDFRFRLLATKGASEFDANYDFAIDNIEITGATEAGEEEEEEPTVPSGTRAAQLDTGLRSIFVNGSTGNDSNNGLSSGAAKKTIQAAVNIRQPGDVIRVADGRYAGFTINGGGGTQARPIWIAAENPYGAVISNMWPEAEAGTQSWADRGSGVYRAAHAQPYIGWYPTTGDMLFYHKSEADLKAGTVSTSAGTVQKPAYGIAFQGGFVYVKLPGSVNPNGQVVKITDTNNKSLVNVDNANFVFLDGFQFEGAGLAAAVIFGPNSRNCITQNCKFLGCRFGVRCRDDHLIDTCEYAMEGMANWVQDVNDLNGFAAKAAFKLVKNYYNGTVIGSNAGNALLEGSLDHNQFGQNAGTNLVLDNCWSHDCFDGANPGLHRNVEIKNSLFSECFDDGWQSDSTTGPDTSVSGDLKCHDCKFDNCHLATSHQTAPLIHARDIVYRCVFIISDPDLQLSHAFIKTIKTDGAVTLHYYHNLFIMRGLGPAGDGGEGRTVWWRFSNGTSGKIKNFFNNIVMFEDRLDLPNTGTANLPTGISNNVVVSPSDNAASDLVQGANGVYAGDEESDMLLNADFSLQASSPARNIGKALPAGLPDSRSGAGVNDDAGPFPFGEAPGADWPRAKSTIFVDRAPVLWTSPGGAVGGQPGIDVEPLDAWTNVSTSLASPGSKTVSAGTNRGLFVMTSSRAATAVPITGVSYGGEAMTLVESESSTGGPDLDTALWFLDEAGIAAASDANFSITPASGTTEFRLHAGSYEHVDQTDPIVDSFNSASVSAGDDPIASALSTVDGGMALALIGINQGDDTVDPDPDASFSNLTQTLKLTTGNSLQVIGHAATSGAALTPTLSTSHQSRAHLLGASIRWADS